MRGIGTKIALAAAFVLVLALPFLFRPRPAPVTADGKSSGSAAAHQLVIVSPHWEGVRTEFGRAFSAHTQQRFGHATELEWLDIGGASDALRYVRSEFTRSPDGIGIDLFFGGGVDPYLQLAGEGLLDPATIRAEVLAAIPPELGGIEVYDPQGRWFGTCLAGFGIIYNRKVLATLELSQPETWGDLTDPRFFTWVGAGDPRSSGSVHMAYEIILQAYGWQPGWAVIAAMGGNTRNFSRAASDVPKDTALGEVACGLAIDVYAWRQVAEVGAERMGFVLPEGLTVINPDGIAVLKGAPNRDVAVRFIEFVLSEAGQTLWAGRQGAPGGPQAFELDRMSVIPGFGQKLGSHAAVTFDPYVWRAGFRYDAAKGGLRWTILNDLLGATIIDTHGELVAAWRAVKDMPADAPRRRRLLRPPISEEELVALAESQWDDAELRTRTRSRWAAAARDLYRKVARGTP